MKLNERTIDKLIHEPFERREIVLSESLTQKLYTIPFEQKAIQIKSFNALRWMAASLLLLLSINISSYYMNKPKKDSNPYYESYFEYSEIKA